MRLVEVEAVLLEPGEIDDAEVGAARGVVRRRLSEIVPAAPHETARDVRMRVERGEHLVRRGAERRRVQLVAADVLGLRIAAACRPAPVR